MIGQKIQELRKNKRMSLSEVAEQAGVAKSYLSSIERGIQSNPSIQFMEKIGKVLGVTVNELLLSQDDQAIRAQLDEDWLKLAEEAMRSGISKKEFQEFVEFSKWKKSH
ncbi:helix-turn-helix domain-containing protein [Gracilibacillus oryzae]|uniref:Helix-turn-helix domain-containing protein n=1 Tax=Gracilibacillus oryzae TaxID=1672701 RepID=A0A7C8GVW1_9BACI|nr:helix-turn-helix domain-containing protein [Gracilibacillus oryzae]KAB8139492.1 helix-turn-helix domain-containing protein [Gracilibacillus oryzae]